MPSITVRQFHVAWGFLYPFLKARAEASAPLADDLIVIAANKMFQQDYYVQRVIDVINGVADVQVLRSEVASEDLEACRVIHRSFGWLSGMILDTCRAAEASTMSAPEGLGMGVDTALVESVAEAAVEKAYDEPQQQ